MTIQTNVQQDEVRELNRRLQAAEAEIRRLRGFIARAQAQSKIVNFPYGLSSVVVPGWFLQDNSQSMR